MYRPTEGSIDSMPGLPRPRIAMFAVAPPSSMNRLGVRTASPASSAMPFFSRVAAVSTTTEIGTFCRLCSRFWAVTTISSRARRSDWASE
ncbi:MAG: hypothetical protein IPO20_22275 [Gammaproteobacteria bacterium]|nr:hypothetical protein [Gammaproteobacteria bacterium]